MNIQSGCTVLIENLTPEVKISDILTTYAKCGVINEIILGHNQALVVFDDEDEADASIVYTTIGEVEVDVSITELSTLDNIADRVDYVQLRQQQAAAAAAAASSAAEATAAAAAAAAASSAAEAAAAAAASAAAAVAATVAAAQQASKEEDDVEIIETKVQEVLKTVEVLKPEPVHHIVEEVKKPESPVKQVVHLQPEPVLPSPVKEVSQPVVEMQHVHQVELNVAPVVTVDPDVAQKVAGAFFEKLQEVAEIVAPIVQEHISSVADEPVPVVASPVKKTPLEVQAPAEATPAKCPFSGATLATAATVAAAAPASTGSVSKCPFASSMQNTSQVSTPTPAPTSAPAESEPKQQLDSVQLLSALKNASIHKRVRLGENDLFNKVKDQLFLQVLVAVLVGFTVYSNLF